MFNQHGGNLDAIEREYGIKKELIKDFSGNVNPLGPPKAVLDTIIGNVSAVTRYPDVTYQKLRESIASYAGVSSEFIMVGNGSTELISLFIKSVNPKKAIVISPAYSEYEHELAKLGCETIQFPLLEENNFVLDMNKLLGALGNDIQLLVICNPNNPTGSSLTKDELATILTHCTPLNIMVMVDETYAEFATKEIVSTELIPIYKNLFTIRGTSKFFSVPGLRLGYAMCSNTEINSQVLSKKDPWSVNILSSLAGEKMFTDSEFIAQTKQLMIEQREFFYRELEKIPSVKFYESQSNFILVKFLDENIKSSFITAELLKKNLLIRDASSFPFLDESFLRFCILLPENNVELMTELKKYLH